MSTIEICDIFYSFNSERFVEGPSLDVLSSALCRQQLNGEKASVLSFSVNSTLLDWT